MLLFGLVPSLFRLHRLFLFFVSGHFGRPLLSGAIVSPGGPSSVFAVVVDGPIGTSKAHTAHCSDLLDTDMLDTRSDLVGAFG